MSARVISAALQCTAIYFLGTWGRRELCACIWPVCACNSVTRSFTAIGSPCWKLCAHLWPETRLRCDARAISYRDHKMGAQDLMCGFRKLRITVRQSSVLCVVFNSCCVARVGLISELLRHRRMLLTCFRLISVCLIQHIVYNSLE